ncbi:MAG: DUF4154 domain-containing protein [Syntrophus sp. (in: bacteria)]|nr:DUF4154 domain-containing protein [Syntrophus sp. (in: bacteria)]
MRNPSYFRFIIIFLSAITVFATSFTHGEELEFSEYELKAGFIYNIAKFVEWPDKKTADTKKIINLYVLGSDPFGRILDQITGKKVKGKILEVKHIRSPKDLRDCHMLFISSSEREKLPDILESLKDSNILTIGDTNGYGQQGVIINFYMEQKKVRFEVNTNIAKRAKLSISSQLLKLAKIIHSE